VIKVILFVPALCHLKTGCTGVFMSLAEVPENHIRRNGQLTHPRGALQHGGLRPIEDENYGTPQKPSPLQNMLKTTTETGDIGQFSIKPPRVPASSLQLSPATSSKARATPSKRRHLVPYDDGYSGHDTPYSPGSPRQNHTGPNGSGFHIRGNRGPRQRPSLEDYHSYSMTQNSYNNHSLTHRPPYTNEHHYSRGDFINTNNGRPRSPYAYPTRLKRPGHRPSSPTLNDINRSVAGYTQGLGRKPSSRTVSPLSAYNMNRTPSPFRYVINRSDPDLQHYPPYLGTEPKRHRSSSVTSTRPSTPKLSPSVASISSSSHVYRQKSARNGGRARPRSPPVSPVFYDYTEEFEEYGDHQNSTSSSGLLTDQPLLAMESSTYSELGVSQDSAGIPELPCENIPQRFMSQPHQMEVNQKFREVGSAREAFIPTAPQDLSDVPELPELPEKEMAAIRAETLLETDQRGWVESHPNHHQQSPVTQQVQGQGQRVLPSDDGHIGHTAQELAAESTASRVSRASDHGPTSPTGSMFSVKSSDPPDPPYLTPEPGHGPLPSPVTHQKLEIPVGDHEQKETSVKADSVHLPESLRGPSFEGHSGVSTEILSPTPERSIISPSSRDRFSRILSIEEDQLDLEPLASPPKREERMATPIQGKYSIDSWETSGAFRTFRRKHSLFTQNSPLKHNMASGPLVEKSDSEEEPELTIGLRQTFCKDDKTISQLRQLTSPSISPPQSLKVSLAEPVSVERSSAARNSSANLPLSPKRLPTKTARDDGHCESISGHAPLPTGTRWPLDTDNVPPQLPRKQRSFRSFSPPTKPHASDLPLDFTPLVRRASEDDSVGDEYVPTPSPGQENAIRGDELTQMVVPEPEVHSNRSSAASPSDSLGSRPTSRPWNHDSSYPWSDELPVLDVTIPPGTLDSQKGTEKPPRFKLKVQRASTSTGGTNKLRKEMVASESFRPPLASSLDLGQGQALRRKRDPNLSVIPGQINSSHDILHSSRQRTRFVDTFETQSPTISLVPPSPNHEARSFFSDDSSQIRPKGAIRKRFSDFRARAAASRANSMDEIRGYDRGLLSSALGRSRASGRSSRQSQNTAGTSTRTSIARRVGWRMVDKIRLWLNRGEDKVRDWRWKIRYRSGKNRVASAPLYPGA